LVSRGWADTLDMAVWTEGMPPALFVRCADGLDLALALGETEAWLLPQDAALTVVAESIERRDAVGRPIIKLREVLPAPWAQPAVRQHFVKGPANYSGQGREERHTDWAGQPFTEQRARARDHGPDSVLFTKIPSLPPVIPRTPPRLSLPRLITTEIEFQWSADDLTESVLLASPTVTGPYQPVRIISDITNRRGTLRMAMPTRTTFYRIEQRPITLRSNP
jgi:hypothetical protein